MPDPHRPRRSRPPTRRVALAGVLTVLALAGAACSDPARDSPAGATTSAVPRDDWDPAALERLRPPAEALAASAVGCADIAAHPYEAYRLSFEQARVPTPAASLGCTTTDGGDLTFEAFDSAAAVSAFLDAKAELLCARGRELDPEQFPGLPYVDGGDWILEPDDDATARAAAEVLGLPAGNACGEPDAGGT